MIFNLYVEKVKIYQTYITVSLLFFFLNGFFYFYRKHEAQ